MTRYTRELPPLPMNGPQTSNAFPLTVIRVCFLVLFTLDAPATTVAVSRTVIFGGGGGALRGVLISREVRAGRGCGLVGNRLVNTLEALTPGSVESFSTLASIVETCGLFLLNVGGGSFS